MFDGYIDISKKEIPRTLLGTSPFTAAPQFGHRARLYHLDLYSNPDNILKIIKKSYDMGVRGIQVIPYPPVVDAITNALEIGLDMEIIGTVRTDNEENDIGILTDLKASSMILHGATTDKHDWDFIGAQLQNIEDTGAIPGLATHMPFGTTQKLLKSPILDLFNIYMIPVNKLGYLMDCDVYGPEKRREFSEMMKRINKFIIIKKVLAAGILQPEEAFDYIKTLDFANVIAVGIASEDEAEHTFGLLDSKK